MRILARARRTSPDLPASVPDLLRRIVRRLAPAECAALGAAWDITGGVIASDTAVIVLAPPTEPSARLVTSAHEAARAFSSGAGASFHSDPTFLVEMMDNTLLAALTIGAGFDGDAVNVGASSEQRRAALDIGADRLATGAAHVLLVGGRPPATGYAALVASGGDDDMVLAAWLENACDLASS